jgi:hypothetical protein
VCECVGVTGEQFLRVLASEAVAAGDLQWHQRFYSVVEALEIVDAIDIEAARAVGQEIRAGLSARTGEPGHDFFVASRRGPRRHRPNRPGSSTGVPQVSVRAARASLPPKAGDGATNFVSRQGETAWLVCSGGGPAPWPEHRPPSSFPIAGTLRDDGVVGGWAIASGLTPIGPPSPPFRDVVDDRGRHYRLSHASSGASSSGSKRRRWDMRAAIEPAPGDDVAWLELVTEHGPIRAVLRPPVPTTATTVTLAPRPSEVGHHMTAKMHNQVWLHLLDTDRPLEPLGVIPQALVAVGAIDSGDPLVAAVLAVDAALAGDPPAAAMPEVLAGALRRDPAAAAWLGVEALGVSIDNLDGANVALEAMVGHRDRLAVHFVQSSSRDGRDASELIVSATDNLGGGYAGHAEPLGGMEAGAYHLRPPLDSAADRLVVTLQGPAHRTTIEIDLVA